MSSETFLVSTSDIAELADERLAVVSTWRNRFKESPNAFPSPVGGTPARPLFDFDAVSEWVSRNRPEISFEGRLLPVRVWSAIRSLTTTGVDQFELVYWLHLILAKRKAKLSSAVRELGFPSPDDLLREATRGEAAQALIGMVDDASIEELVAISDFALARLSAGYGRSGGQIGAVGSNISGILARAAMVHLVSTTGNAVVYDPSCGIGETLIRVAGSYEKSQRRVRIIGTEINTQVAAIATIRLELRDIPAEIAAANSLATQQFPDQGADLVVAEPPLGVSWAGLWPDSERGRFGIPPLRNADLAWVIDAVVRLREGGCGLVLTSIAALSRGGAEERVRAALVRSGAVETIIALPPNLLQYTGVGLALWVVRAPDDDQRYPTVHVIDATDPDFPESGTTKRAEWIEQHIANWVLGPSDVDPVLGVTTAVVHFDELLDSGMDLTPTRWVAEVASDDIRHNLFLMNTFFGSNLEKVRTDPPDFDELPSAAHIVTVREMTETPESREAKLWVGRGVSNEDAPDDTITSRDLAAGRLRTLTEMTEGSGTRTEPGDIVFTTMSRVRALVDLEGGHRLGNGVHALRLDAGSRFDPEYVARCLSARWNERHQKGSTIKHAKPGDLEIPLLPLDAQREWLSAFATLAKIRNDAQHLVESADELETAAFNALRYGHQEDR